MKWNRIKEHGKTIGASVLVLILIWIATGGGTFEKPADNANSGETAQPFRMNGAPISVLTA